MKKYQVEIKITGRSTECSDKVNFTAQNRLALCFINNRGKVLGTCRFLIENSYEIELDNTKEKAIIATHIGESSEITDVFFGHDMLFANLVVMPNLEIFNTEVKPFLLPNTSVTHNLTKEKEDKLKKHTNVVLRQLMGTRS
jgi:hypothetical protein